MIEVALFAVLVLFTVIAARMLREGGPVAHWIAGWSAAGIAGFVPFMGSAYPLLELAAHPLGTLYAALLLSGTLLFVGRPMPRWLLPAALALGLMRAGVAARAAPPPRYGLGFACEPWAVFAAAALAIARARRRRRRAAPSAARSRAGRSSARRLRRISAGSQRDARLGARAALARRRAARARHPDPGGGRSTAAPVRHALEERVAERTRELAASEERYRTISELSSDFAFKIRIDRDCS